MSHLLLHRIRRDLLRGAAVFGVVVAGAGAFVGIEGVPNFWGQPVRYRVGQCKPGQPLAGVYIPGRLTVKAACTTVSGTVDCLKQEPDGDIHLRLLPDPKYRRLLTPANSAQVCAGNSAPHLVVEIIPQDGHLPFPENSASRGHFVTPTAPRPGDHISVTGPYVWDSNALHDLLYPGKNVKNWAEIHPAWAIRVNGHSSTTGGPLVEFGSCAQRSQPESRTTDPGTADSRRYCMSGPGE